jgi:uncharacterized protein
MVDGQLTRPPHIVFRRDGSLRPAEGQCDACSTSVGTVQTPPPSTQRYVLSAPVVRELGDEYTAVGGPLIRGGALLLNRSALAVARHFDRPRALESVPPAWRRAWGGLTVRAALKQMVTLGLLTPHGCGAPALVETPHVLGVWLHLTNACQLACDYCYRPRSGGEMTPEVGRRAVDATFRSALAHGYARIKLKYAGGEPTLRFPLVIGLHRHAADLARRCGLELEGVVISNGVALTPRTIETIQELDLRLAISLDGVGRTHDAQRHTASGRGSFERVARSIDLALAHGLAPDLSITVSGRNADGLAELMAWVLDRDLLFSLNFYRETDRPSACSDLQLEEERIVAGMLAAYEVIGARLPERSLLASLADRANLAAPHLHPCSAGHSYLVFDHLGRVAKCQMDMAHTVADADDADPLNVVRRSRSGILNPRVDERAECRGCPWRYWCAGGCPLMAFRATGRYDAPSPSCGIYRALFPEIVHLEGFGLLRQAGIRPQP